MSQVQAFSRTSIHLAAPAAGTTKSISSEAGARLELGFDPRTASFERVGTDLTVRVDGGGDVVLRNFFAVGDQPLPIFVLADGEQVSSGDLLSSFDSGFDTSTSEGPSASYASSGISDYYDAPGGLVGGLDRLESLGSVQWDNGTPFAGATPVPGAPLAGYGPVAPAPENPAPEDPVPGNPVPGNPAPENPVPGNPAPGDPIPAVPPGEGGNTAPSAAPATAVATEDAPPIRGNLADSVTDPDAGDSKSFTYGTVTYTDGKGAVHTVSAEEAGLTLHPDGAWTLDPSSPLYDALGRGDTGNLRVEYTVTDSGGATGSASLTVTVEGVDPLPRYGVKVALTGLDEHPNPKVTMPLLDADGNPYPGPDYPASITVPGLDESKYSLEYDPANGIITITMKTPGQAAGPEALEVIPEGAGTGYIISLASAGDDALDKVTWNYPDSVTAIWGTWAGTSGHHLDGNDLPADISGAGNNVNTPLYDAAGVPLHLQFTDSSFTARNDAEPGAEQSGIAEDFGPGGGSLTLINESRISDITVHHDTPWRYSDGQPYPEESFPNTDYHYDASLSATIVAKGGDAVNSISVTGGETIIKTGDGRPATSAAADHSRVSAVYAMEGGSVLIDSDKLNIEASASGFTPGEGKPAVITGVRADGVHLEEGADWVTDSDQSTVRISGTEVTLGVTITGDTDLEDHSYNTYAAVAATERGRVDVTAETAVNVRVDNRAEGDSLATDGAYGIFAGYGLGRGDLPTMSSGGSDFYQQYIREKYDGTFGGSGPGHQSQVNVTSDADVNVAVNLGSTNYSGAASGVRNNYGDVSVKAANDINVSTVLNGEHRGDAYLSAVNAGSGFLNLEAGGNVNLTLDSNGEQNAVINITGGNGGQGSSSYKNATSLHLSGRNVILEGVVGADGSAADNHIEGFAIHNSPGGGFKKANFAVEAEDTFSIHAVAYNNGGSTSATGILDIFGGKFVGNNIGGYYGYQEGLYVNADKMEVKAEIRNDGGKVLPADASAIGINVVGTAFSLESYNGGEQVNLAGYGSGSGWYYGKFLRPQNELEVSASGGRFNAGIQVSTGDFSESTYRGALAGIAAETMTVNVTGGATSGDSHSYGIRASSNVSSSSYGSKAQIQVGTLTVNVEDASEAVGLSADGLGSELRVEGNVGGYSGYDAAGNYFCIPYDEALKVVINCRLTGGDDLKGIAVEALNGGRVLISANSSQGVGTKDAEVVLNGDVVVGVSNADAVSSFSSGSEVALQGGTGNDRFALNGDALVGTGGKLLAPESGTDYAYKSNFYVDTGDGDDRFSVNGAVHIGWESRFTVDTGSGNDDVSITGGITYTDDGNSGYGSSLGGAEFRMGYGNDHLHLGGGVSLATVDMGEGNDILSFNGAVASGLPNDRIMVDGGEGHDVLVLEAPNLETFNVWYKDWLEAHASYYGEDALSQGLRFESVIVTGINDPADPAFQWFQTLMEQESHIDFQVYTGSLKLHMLSDLSNVSAFQMDGTGVNDMLYVRYDGNNGNLDNLNGALGRNGHIKGLEGLLFDMSDGQTQEIDLNAFSSVLDSLRAPDSPNANADVFLKVGAEDTLSVQGWNARGVDIVNGIEYQVYNSIEDEALRIHVQILQATG